MKNIRKMNYELLNVKSINAKKMRNRIGWISREEVITLYCLESYEITRWIKNGKIRSVIISSGLERDRVEMFIKTEIEELILAERISIEAELDLLIAEMNLKSDVLRGR